MDNKNNLQDKLERSYSTESTVLARKEQKDKNKKIIIGIVSILLVLFFAYFILSSRNKSGNEDDTKQTKVQDNIVNKTTGEQVRIQKVERDEDSENLVDDYIRPKVLDNSYIDLAMNEEEKKAEILEKLGTTSEFEIIPDDITNKRNKFYNANVQLFDRVSEILPSEKDGNTSDPTLKMNGSLINNNYTPRTAEEITSFLSHELEKIANPKYMGYSDDGINSILTSLIIEEYPYQGDDINPGTYIPEFKVNYTISNFKESKLVGTKQGSFSFMITEEGEIVWTSRE